VQPRGGTAGGQIAARPIDAPPSANRGWPVMNEHRRRGGRRSRRRIDAVRATEDIGGAAAASSCRRKSHPPDHHPDARSFGTPHRHAAIDHSPVRESPQRLRGLIPGASTARVARPLPLSWVTCNRRMYMEHAMPANAQRRPTAEKERAHRARLRAQGLARFRFGSPTSGLRLFWRKRTSSRWPLRAAFRRRRIRLSSMRSPIAANETR
jgi:hypothetical protein